MRVKRAMKRRLAAVLTACAAAVSLAVPVSAAPQLPFELTPPERVSLTCTEDAGSGMVCTVSWGKNSSMNEWTANLYDPEKRAEAEAAYTKLGYSDVWYDAQMDWSIDSTENWHYNAYWDSEGYDEKMCIRLGSWAYTSLGGSEEPINSAPVFCDMGNIDDTGNSAWYGRHAEGEDYVGWKDVLKEGQYEIAAEGDEHHAKINLREHTIYVRMRWAVTVMQPDGNETRDFRVFSGWSDIASIGRDAVQTAPQNQGAVTSDLQISAEETLTDTTVSTAAESITSHTSVTPYPELPPRNDALLFLGLLLLLILIVVVIAVTVIVRRAKKKKKKSE